MPARREGLLPIPDTGLFVRGLDLMFQFQRGRGGSENKGKPKDVTLESEDGPHVSWTDGAEHRKERFMPHVNRDGLSLYYEQAGSGDPALVFIHGWCCDHTFFQPQFDRLRVSHAVTSLDLRGCGNSDRPEHGYDIPTLADDVAWLCCELSLSKPIFVGHSLGGMIAIELAARYPSLPTAIIAVDPGPIDPLPQTSRLFEGFVAQLEGPEEDAVRRTYIQGMFLATDDTDRKRWIVETMCSVPQRVAVAVLRGVLAWNGVGALLLCNAPLLVLRSQPGGSNAPARMLALKPDIHIGVTVGAGHFHQLEVPEQVTPMIERFIQLVTGQSAPVA